MCRVVLLLSYALLFFFVLSQLLYVRGKELPVPACSDVLVSGDSGPSGVIGHNEDNNPAIGKYAVLVTFTVDAHPTFTAYMYPLMVPGVSVLLVYCR